MSVRAEQKLRTRRALMDASLRQLSADRGFGSLSLREIAREAGIAPTSFYRHFTDLDELGLALVDEAGVALRQLMRQARKRIEREGGAINTSVETFMEYLTDNANLFRLLLRERTGVSRIFRTAVQAEIDHFVTELAEDLEKLAVGKQRPLSDPYLVAESMVVLVFHLGAEALDAPAKQRANLKEKLKVQLRMVLVGAQTMAET
ncbi:MAG: HTH-type transcriptional repressor FabR [Pseudomonadota bacterium]